MKSSATCTICTVLLLALTGLPAAADDAEPRTATASSAGSAPAAEPARTGTEAAAVIGDLQDVLIELMKNADELGYEGRRIKIEPALEEAFDLNFMAEKAAGRHWRGFGDEQKATWLETFRRMTVANYAGRFDGYSGQSFVQLGTQAAGFDTILVRTKLVQPADDDVEINYRMREQDGGWKVIDIYLNGTVSELALRRAEYGSAIERDGFEKLVQDLETKITNLKTGSSG